jgi:phosphoglycolate phosphatase
MLSRARRKSAASCPICGCGSFVDFRGRPAERCRDCGAHTRTRSVWLMLTEVCRIGPGSRVLHFAPEPALAPRLREICGEGYRPHDLNAARYRFGFEVAPCDLCTDIPRLFAPGSFDVVMHNHVLEHLPCNYTVVLQRLHALLRPGGHHVFSFPVGHGHYRSDFSPELSEAERAARFGQKDHVRRFTGHDFDSTIGMVFDELDHDYSMARFIPEATLRAAAIPPERWTLAKGPVFIVEKKEPHA